MNADEQLEKLEQQLMESKKLPYNDRISLPDRKGCYVIREDGDTVVYVGETSSLLYRMKDLQRTQNHSLRRRVGFKIIGRKVTAFERYTNEEEKLLDDYFEKHMTVQFLVMDLGRKELEDRLIEKYRLTLYNRNSRR